MVLKHGHICCQLFFGSPAEDCVDEYFVHIHGCLSQVFVLSHKYPVIKNI